MDVREDIKGISRFVFAEGALDDKLHLHISEVGPGQRAHAPHSHGGQEIFYVFNSQGEGHRRSGNSYAFVRRSHPG